jgi:hypothetical protein
MTTNRARRPRCYVLYALAPEGIAMPAANNCINALVGDNTLPLAIFHDHFLDRPGGLAVFYAQSGTEIEALDEGIARHLDGWRVETRPLIFSFSPAAFDEQIAYTLRTYRNEDWAALQTLKRPSYGNPSREAETGIEN